jgi:hypothetical protein
MGTKHLYKNIKSLYPSESDDRYNKDLLSQIILLWNFELMNELSMSLKIDEDKL